MHLKYNELLCHLHERGRKEHFVNLTPFICRYLSDEVQK